MSWSEVGVKIKKGAVVGVKTGNLVLLARRRSRDQELTWAKVFKALKAVPVLLWVPTPVRRRAAHLTQAKRRTRRKFAGRLV